MESIIVSGSYDKTVRLWRGNWKTWLDVACDRLREHPVLVEPETTLAQGETIEEAKAARETCQKFVWSKTENSQ